MSFFQKEIALPSFPRGFHLITRIIQEEFTVISKIKIGVLYIFIKHTSASLTINENADSTVRTDLENHFNEFVPENASYYEHTFEGADDMPAHIKSSLLGNSLTIPITNGSLNLGTWQGIYLCEHRNYGSSRKIVLTAHGEAF